MDLSRRIEIYDGDKKFRMFKAELIEEAKELESQLKALREGKAGICCRVPEMTCAEVDKTSATCNQCYLNNQEE